MLLSLTLSVGLNSVCIGVLFFLTLVKLIRSPKQHQIGDHVALLSPILIFITLAISLLYTEDMALGLDMVFRKNAYVILPIIAFVNQDIFRDRLKDFFSTYLIGLSISGLATLLLFCVPESSLEVFIEGKDWLREYTPSPNRLAFGIYSPFMDRLHFGYLLGVGGILHLWYLLNGKVKPLGVLSFAIVILTLIFIGARAAQLAFGIAAFSIFVFWYFSKTKQSKGQRKGVGLIILLSFVIVPWLLYQYVPAITERYNQMMWEIDIYRNKDITQYDYPNFTSVRRIFSWINTFELTQDNWILGVGIGDVVSELEKVYQSKNLNCPPNSHNQFLLYWVSAGLLALLAWLFSLLSYFRVIWKRQAGPTRIIALSFLLYYLVIFFFDVPLWYSVGINGFYTFFCLFLISSGENRREALP